MKRWCHFAVLVFVFTALSACARSGDAFPNVQIVTVIASVTAGPTQTPVLITKVQTVVVTATPSVTATPTPTSTPTLLVSTESAVQEPQPTERPRPSSTIEPTRALSHVAPRLTTPGEGVSFTSSEPVLEWEPMLLGDGEYYEVTIERFWQNQPYYSGSDWVTEPRFVVPSFVRGTSDTGHYTWWVTIKRLTGTNATGGKIGEAISPPSEQRTFTWVTQ